jgi:hypothetical protein
METQMAGDQPISWLMFFTLAAAIVIAGFAFLGFLRSQRNRDIAANALVKGGNTGRVAPQGALPELLGIAVIGFIAMGLLFAGYKSKSTFETAQSTTPVGTTGSSMSQPVGTADRPKQYQPANPEPDTRSAPTSSDTGTGSANGSTGNPK